MFLQQCSTLTQRRRVGLSTAGALWTKPRMRGEVIYKEVNKMVRLQSELDKRDMKRKKAVKVRKP